MLEKKNSPFESILEKKTPPFGLLISKNIPFEADIKSILGLFCASVEV